MSGDVGIVLDVVYRDATPSPRCPRCSSALADPVNDQYTCLVCGGRLVPYRAVAHTVVTVLASTPAAVPLSSLHCPLCGQPMRRTRVTSSTGEVEVDSCDRHGLWFDRDELQQLSD